MKASHIKNYGGQNKVLRLLETKQAEPKNTAVLVRVRATAINDYDWLISRGRPIVYCLIFSIFRPRKKLMAPGMEVAGIVEQIGKNATKFKIGYAVYGDISNFSFGSFAELLCIWSC